MENPAQLPTKKLQKLARHWVRHGMPNSRRDRLHEIRALRDAAGRGTGGLSLVDAGTHLEDIVRACITSRMARNEARRPKPNVARFRRGRPYHLPSGTPDERLQIQRWERFVRSMHMTLRSYAREDAPSIAWCDNLSACRITCAREHGWITYSKKHPRRFGIVSAQYFVTAMPRLPIPREISGLLTLGAERARDCERASHPEEEVYRVVWARQGADGPVREVGFVVRTWRGDETGCWCHAHGKTVSSARGTLTARFALADRRDREARWALAIEQLLTARRLNGHDVLVRFSDAREAGLCSAGICSWCHRHGLDPHGSARVSQLLAIDDQPGSVMAACVRAVMRQTPVQEIQR